MKINGIISTIRRRSLRFAAKYCREPALPIPSWFSSLHLCFNSSHLNAKSKKPPPIVERIWSFLGQFPFSILRLILFHARNKWRRRSPPFALFYGSILPIFLMQHIWLDFKCKYCMVYGAFNLCGARTHLWSQHKETGAKARGIASTVSAFEYTVPCSSKTKVLKSNSPFPQNRDGSQMLICQL